MKSVDERLASRIAAASIFVAAFFVFWLSPVYQGGDSKYSMLVSESLLQHGTVRLDAYRIPRLLPKYGEDHIQNGDMYQLDIVGDHLYHFFPPGSPVLSAPYVALLNASGVSAANPDQTFNEKGEETIQRSLAALLMALLAVVFFKTSRMLLPVGWSAVVALGGAFGTQIWSTASRGVWSQTWEALLLGVVVWMLLAQETSQRKLNPILLASILAWMYFVRPPGAVSIVAVTVYIFIFQRRLLLSYSLTGAAWFAGFVAYSWHNFHRLLPDYYMANRLQFGNFRVALAGNAISPSRGVFVFVPWLFFIVYVLVKFRREQAFGRLVWLSIVIAAAQLIVASGFAHWWGGSSYGARMTTGIIPWCVLLGVLGLDAMRRQRAAQQHQEENAKNWSLRQRAMLFAGALLLLLSVFINGRGAFSPDTAKWNDYPLNVDKRPERLWDWRYPQFAAGLVATPLPQADKDFPFIEPRINFGAPEADKYLWYGWSSGEGDFRWTSANKAAFIFTLDKIIDTVAQIKMMPFLAPGKLDGQHVKIKLNDQSIADLELREPVYKIYSIGLPARLLRRRNALVFELPDAVAPRDLNFGGDPRALGVRIEWMDFQSTAATATH